jgi:hypothetical protein
VIDLPWLGRAVEEERFKLDETGGKPKRKGRARKYTAGPMSSPSPRKACDEPEIKARRQAIGRSNPDAKYWFCRSAKKFSKD